MLATPAPLTIVYDGRGFDSVIVPLRNDRRTFAHKTSLAYGGRLGTRVAGTLRPTHVLPYF
jgi:hypothetical protein